MYLLALYINILILLPMYCEPSNTYVDYWKIHSDNSESFNVSDEAIRALERKLFFNITAPAKTSHPLTERPRSPSSKSAPPSSFPRENFDENITNSYYTTHVDDYPDFSVIEMKLKKFPGIGIRDSLPPLTLDTHSLIEQDAHTYRHLCRTEIQLITPREIVNKANKPVKIVNYSGLYEQIILAETCGEKDSPCNYSENFPNNLIAICKQNYIFRKLVTMSDSKDPDLAVEDIPIPSCCECVLKDKTMG